ncbi:hypothetical protein ACHAXA_005347, partial [Cyclostephanos tholiformis]
AGLTDPLPNPPKGQEWSWDPSTREWKLVPVTTTTTLASHRIDRIIGSVDRREHRVLETDTFAGICLKYGITPVSLRRANDMLGDDLKLAPDVLVIPPMGGEGVGSSRRGGGEAQTKEEKIASLVSRARLLSSTMRVGGGGGSAVADEGLSNSEARAYLEMADWDVNAAIGNIEEDISWSSGVREAETLGDRAMQMVMTVGSSLD